MWKLEGESARSSDESTQTGLKPTQPGPTALLFVPLFGGGREVPSWAMCQGLSGDPGLRLSS